jgi:hypothetical protein
MNKNVVCRGYGVRFEERQVKLLFCGGLASLTFLFTLSDTVAKDEYIFCEFSASQVSSTFS